MERGTGLGAHLGTFSRFRAHLGRRDFGAFSCFRPHLGRSEVDRRGRGLHTCSAPRGRIVAGGPRWRKCDHRSLSVPTHKRSTLRCSGRYGGRGGKALRDGRAVWLAGWLHFAHMFEKYIEFGDPAAVVCTRVRVIRRIRSSNGSTLRTCSKNTTN